MVKRPEEDFDISSIVKADEHRELVSRVDKLENKDNFADTFCTVTAELVRVKECLNKSIIELIQKNEPCRQEIKNLIAETDKRTVKAFLKNVGGITWGAILYVAGIVTAALLKKFLHAP